MTSAPQRDARKAQAACFLPEGRTIGQVSELGAEEATEDVSISSMAGTAFRKVDLSAYGGIGFVSCSNSAGKVFFAAPSTGAVFAGDAAAADPFGK